MLKQINKIMKCPICKLFTLKDENYVNSLDVALLNYEKIDPKNIKNIYNCSNCKAKFVDIKESKEK